MKPRFDVVVAGGGPAGAACALRLCKEYGASVALIERGNYSAPKIGESLPPEIRPVLERLDLWQQFLKDQHLPSPGIVSIWGSQRLSEVESIANPYGPGWHIDRLRFERTLVDSARTAGAHVYVESSIRLCQRAPNGIWILDMNGTSPQEVDCRALVVAAGRSNCGLSEMGQRHRADRLVGVIGVFYNSRCSDRRTLLEATETGWWYSALLPHHRQMVALMTDADLLGLTASPSVFGFWKQKLGETLYVKRWAEGGDLIGRIKVVPSSMISRDRIAGDGWLAIGDAAFTLDPLSGQGVYKGLVEAHSAAYAIGAFLDGSSKELKNYARESHFALNASLRSHRDFYATETRWPDSPFWRRRQGTAARPPPSVSGNLPDVARPVFPQKYDGPRFSTN